MAEVASDMQADTPAWIDDDVSVSTSASVSSTSWFPSAAPEADDLGPAAADVAAESAVEADATNSTNSVLLLDSGTVDMVARGSILALFIIVGFVGNIVLLATLAHACRRRRNRNRNRKSTNHQSCCHRRMLNSFLLSLAIANLLDCILSLPLVLGASITHIWEYGDAMCGLNAAFLQVTSLATVAALATLTVDRCLALYLQNRLDPTLTSKTKVNLIVVYTWLQSVALSFPLAANLVPVAPFGARYSCSAGPGTSLIYLCAVSIFGFVLPILTVACGYVSILHKARVNHSSSRATKRQARKDAGGGGQETSRSVRKEISAAKFVGALVVVWCLLEGPYLLMCAIDQFRNSLKSEFAVDVLYLDYPWQVELAVTWIRFSYPSFLPLLTFCWRRDIWRKFKNLVLCRKSNLIDDQAGRCDDSDGPDAVTVSPRSGSGGAESLSRRKEAPSLSFDVPVLFATEKGLHVQTLSKRPRTPRTPVASEHFTAFVGLDDMNATDASGIVTARKCDVMGSQDVLQIDDDTSDYDSTAGDDALLERSGGVVLSAKEAPVEGDLSSSRRRTSGSSRHNSEIMLIPETRKVYDNDAFVGDVLDDPARVDTKSGGGQQQDGSHRRKHRKQNSHDSADVQSIATNATATSAHDETPEVDDDRTLRHVRTSSDSGRGSEEGTISRRDRPERPPLPALLPPSSSPVHARIADVTTNETSTDVPVGPNLGQPKARKKRRRKKKPLDGEDPGGDDGSAGAGGGPSVTDTSVSEPRPPLKLQPLPVSPTHAAASPSPAKLPRKLPSPYKNVRPNGGSGGRSGGGASATARRPDLLQVHGTREAEGEMRHYFRSDSEASAIAEGETSGGAMPANVAARRRRTNSGARRTPSMTSTDTMAHSDVTDLRRRERNVSSSSETVPTQRLTHSDSAADIRRLAAEDASEVKRSPRPQLRPDDVTNDKRSPRPQSRPRRPRRKSDLPRAEGKPPTGEGDGVR